MNPLRSDRRQFIKQFVLTTAVSMCGGKLMKSRVLADADPYGRQLGRIKIRLSDFPGLQYQFGAVRFAFADLEGGYYPFALNRADETTFFAVDTRCTHQGCPVNAFSPLSFSMVCDCHQSEYDIQGRVTRGPAINDLQRYQTEFDGEDTVTVLVPDLEMAISRIEVQQRTGSSVRLRLEFPTIPTGRYKVQFRVGLDDEPVDVFFATTAGGAASETEVLGTGAPRTVWVDSSLARGFYSIALVVMEA